MTDASHVRFSQHTLPNGLRLIVAPDRVAPVVAINIWYDVGSKHEQPGKTGFAHLFEHFMFQGSRHVAKAEHLGIVQGAGGVCNATTYFDRTNYFETLPSHEVDLGLWLEADRMATLMDALSEENLDNQRDVVKNEKRQSYDNRPYGSFYEKLMAAVFSPGHPYHHTPIGSMEDLDAASLEDVTAFFRTYYVPNNAVLTIAG
ncbi:MAG: M16 family metallopeptidase, partial [Chloroflexota bacterium]